MTRVTMVLWGLGLAAVIEVVTCLARFGAGLESTRDTRFLASLTFGLRIHHGYFGVLLLVAAPFIVSQRWRQWVVILGIGLLVSDLVHHFLVLWPLTGDPQFHLTYGDGSGGTPP